MFDVITHPMKEVSDGRFYPVPEDDPLYLAFEAMDRWDPDHALAVAKKTAKDDLRKGAVPLLLVRLNEIQGNRASADKWIDYLLENEAEVEPSYHFEALLWANKTDRAREKIEGELRNGRETAHLHFLKAFIDHQDDLGPEVIRRLERSFELLPQFGVDPTVVALTYVLDSTRVEAEDMYALIMATAMKMRTGSLDDAFHMRMAQNVPYLLQALDAGDVQKVLEFSWEEIDKIEEWMDLEEDEHDLLLEYADDLERSMAMFSGRAATRKLQKIRKREDAVRYAREIFPTLLALSYTIFPPTGGELHDGESLWELAFQLPPSLFRPLAIVYALFDAPGTGAVRTNAEVQRVKWRLLREALGCFWLNLLAGSFLEHGQLDDFLSESTGPHANVVNGGKSGELSPGDSKRQKKAKKSGRSRSKK